MSSMSRDFSSVEDAKDASKIIARLAAAAGRSAASEATAKGLPKVYATARHIIKEAADGTKTILATSKKGAPFFKKYALGTVLHAKR